MECLTKYRSVILTLIVGQVMALLLSGTGVFSQLLQVKYKVTNTATTQTFPNYILLILTFGVALGVRGDIDKVIREHWWEYIILAIIDVETNYLNVLAYEYTTIASAQSILNGFTIFGTVILSLLFLKAQYKIVHYIGMTISVAGVASLFIADSAGNNSSRGRNELLGDTLCMFAATINAVIMVAQDHIVKTRSITEYLGMIGIIGLFISTTQVCVLERNSIAKIQWDLPIVLCFVGYAACLYPFYVLCAILLKLSSATIFDLCVLCANLYNLLFGVLLFSNKFSPLYLVSFSFILIGLVIYNTRVAPTADKEQSPFTAIYWKSYCNSLLCEWRCICKRTDPKLAPLLNGAINNYNTMDDEELETPPSHPKDRFPSPLPSVTVESEEEKNEENNS